MSTLPAQGNPNELTQQVMKSVAENLTSADQQLNSQMPLPCVELEAGSMAHTENSSFNWKSFLQFTSSNTDFESNQQLLKSLFDDDLLYDEQPVNPEPEFIEEPGSMAQNEDMNPIWENWESSAKTMSSLGEEEEEGNPNELPQQLSSHDNSQRDVGEEGVGDFEPNPSHLNNAVQASNKRIQKDCKPRLQPIRKAKRQLEQAGTSAEASINFGQKRKARKTITLREEQKDERKKKKIESDRKYRADKKKELNELRKIKPQCEKLMKIASSFGGIDEMESQINHMNSELCRLQKEEVEYDMFRQVTETEFHQLARMSSKYGGTEEMESMLDKFKELQAESQKLKLMKSKYGEIEDMESVLDKFKDMEAEYHRLELMKSKYGEIGEMESILDKFKDMEAESHRLELMKSKHGEIEDIESMLDKFKDMEAESHILDQLKSMFGVIQETESILDKAKEMEAELQRFVQIKSMFGGIDEIEPEINRLKKTELQFEKHKQMEKQTEMETFQFHASPGSRRQMEFDHRYYAQQQMETDFDRFEQMKSKFGETEEMEMKLDKFHHMEAKLHILEQIKSMLGVIDENGIETEIIRLKAIESQHNKHKQTELLFFQESPGSLQQEQRGSHSLDLNGDSDMMSDQNEIDLNSSAAVSGITPDMQYRDALVDELIASLTDENVASNLDHKGFKYLLCGENKSVGRYTIPPALASTADNILQNHGDIATTSGENIVVVGFIFVLCCAAIKEMGDRSLEEVTEEIIWKWRHAIMNAKRNEFEVEFAMEHLKTVAKGFFGLKARKDDENLKQRMAILAARDEELRKELEKVSNEKKALEDKQGSLTSKQCKICQDAADKFLGKTVGIF